MFTQQTHKSANTFNNMNKRNKLFKNNLEQKEWNKRNKTYQN